MNSDSRNLKSLSILMVDQDQSFRKGLSHGLNPYIENIVECDNPGQAKKVLDFQRMDLILTELNFSGSDGFSFIHYCRGKWPDIPVVVVSAYANEMNRKLNAIGIRSAVEKPVSAQSVLKIIQSIF